MRTLVVICSVAAAGALVDLRVPLRSSAALTPAASCRPATALPFRASRTVVASAVWAPRVATAPFEAVQKALRSARTACQGFARALTFSLMVALVATVSIFSSPSGSALASHGAPSSELVAARSSGTTQKKYTSTDHNLKMQQRFAFIGMAGGVFIWAKMTTDAEDAEERVQVREETKRLESMRKEYTNIEEGVVTDEDLLSSLKARLGNATKTDGDKPDGEPPSAGPPPGDKPPPPSPKGDAGGGAGLLERPSEGGDAPSEEADANPTLASDEDVERLKRMFGGAQ